MNSPKLFISYSWSSHEHQDWVIKLAEDLCADGVDVILDVWDLRVGNEANVFMEQMVSDPEIQKVIIVCDKVYVEKANKREGGVGIETQIISKEIYDKVGQNKFVAVVSEKDDKDKPYLPIYCKTRIYIDLSDQEFYEKNYDKLLRWIYDKSIFQKPKIGKRPSNLEETERFIITRSKSRRVIDTIMSGKSNSGGVLEDYFEAFAESLDNFKINEIVGEYDDLVVKNIEQFSPCRDELINIFIILAKYKNIEDTDVKVHRLFEMLAQYLFVSEFENPNIDISRDNYKFIINELFLYCIAIFLKHNCFDYVSYLFNNKYLIKKNMTHRTNILLSFDIFFSQINCLIRRNARLGMNDNSLLATLLHERCTNAKIQFEYLMQADLILYLRSYKGLLDNEDIRNKWIPHTLKYKKDHLPFEIFVRSTSSSFYKNFERILNIKVKNELINLFKFIHDDDIYFARNKILYEAITGIKNLCIYR